MGVSDPTRDHEPSPLAGPAPPPHLGDGSFVGGTGESGFLPIQDPPEGVWLVDRGDLPKAPESGGLVRSRLFAATWILTLAIASFFARSFYIANPPAQGAQAAILVFLMGCLALLWSPAKLSRRQLRAVELLLFGLLTVFLAVYQAAGAIRYLGAGRHEEIPELLRSSVLYTMALMLTYGMLIPNTWQRAARVIVPMALGPSLVNLWLAWQHPRTFEGHWSESRHGVTYFSDDILMLSIGCILAIYGTHIIHSLRKEAFEARRMGQYTLSRRIASGGMGEVFLAEHQFLKRPCAVKLIRPDRAINERELLRFAREVRAMARLSHWNTVEVYDYGRTADGEFYYVMEYLRGLSLLDLVTKYGPLPPGRVIYLIRQACDALTEAHNAGMIHRDLKPANIFAARRGGRFDVTKLLDFGLVTPAADVDAAELSAEDKVTGSPLFMSPEQASGDRRPDARSDLYSLGAVAYYLLTGHPPFEGQTALRVMTAHARDPVQPPSRLRPDIPADLELVVLRCLAKRPAERFPAAEALEAALAACGSAAEWDFRKAAEWWLSHTSAGEDSSFH